MFSSNSIYGLKDSLARSSVSTMPGLAKSLSLTQVLLTPNFLKWLSNLYELSFYIILLLALFSKSPKMACCENSLKTS